MYGCAPREEARALQPLLDEALEIVMRSDYKEDRGMICMVDYSSSASAICKPRQKRSRRVR